MKYVTLLFVLGKPYISIEEAMIDLDCSKKAIVSYLNQEIDHPYRFYRKHLELNGVLYKSLQAASDDLDVTIRNLRWYLAGEASEAIKSKIERKQNAENDSCS